MIESHVVLLHNQLVDTGCHQVFLGAAHARHMEHIACPGKGRGLAANVSSQVRAPGGRTESLLAGLECLRSSAEMAWNDGSEREL